MANVDGQSPISHQDFARIRSMNTAALAERESQIDPSEQRARQLRWEGCLNARDLGGYPTTNGRKTRCTAIARSDELSGLTEAGRGALIDYGVRSIIDLRKPEEIGLFPSPFARPGFHDIAYTNVPIQDPPSKAPARSFIAGDLSLAGFLGQMLEDFRPGVAAVMKAIGQAQEDCVLVHCAGGRDRTGLVCALLLDLAGVEREAIGADFALSEDCLRPLMEEWLASGPGRREERERVREKLRIEAEVILEVLGRLDERYGGAEAYLLEAGVTTKDIARLRERLLSPAPQAKEAAR